MRRRGDPFERRKRRAVRAAAKNPAATLSGEVRRSIEALPDGRKYVQATRRVIIGDDNFAVFVEYKNGTTEGLAIVEFDASIDPRFIREEYGDTQFHTVVTLLEPDIVRDGMPFDYLVDEVLENPNNIEVKIVREPPARGVIGKIHPNTSSESLSNR